MKQFQNHMFYGRETINNNFPRYLKFPNETSYQCFKNAVPDDLHPQADEFFQAIVSEIPTRSNILFECSGKYSWSLPGPTHIDIRRTLVAADHSGCSVDYKCSKGYSESYTKQAYVSASRYYNPQNFKYMLNLPERIGLPEPTMIQTRGDEIIRYYYFLDYTECTSLKIRNRNLQTDFETLWAGAEVDEDNYGRIMVPGFGNYRCHKNNNAKVRTVGGSRKKIEASHLHSAIQLVARENSDQIIYAFKQSKPHGVGSLCAEDVHSTAEEILGRFEPRTLLGKRHFYVAYVQALIDTGYPSIDHKDIARRLPFNVDLHSCPGHIFPAPDGVNSSYFWNLAKVACNTPRTALEMQQDRQQDIQRKGQSFSKKERRCESAPHALGIVETAEADMERLKQVAAEITAQHKNLYIEEQFQLLKCFSKSLTTKFDQSYIENVFSQSRMYENGSLEPITPEDELRFDSVPWLWENIIIDKTANLLVAQPKTGKTTLILAFIAALLKGEPSFLGKHIQAFTGKVVIIGTDQPESDWARMLESVGLLNECNQMHPSLIKLHTSGCPLHLDERGLETLEGYARENPNLFVLLDSFAACTSVLGLDENSPKAGQVIQQLVSRMATYGATLAIIHHSGKGMGTDSPTTRSRGSTAIPAAVSQIISLSRYSTSAQADESKNNQLVLETEGRAGSPVRMFIQRTDKGWIEHGDGKKLRQEQRRKETIDGLNKRQLACLKYVEDQWSGGQSKVSASQLVSELKNEFAGSDSERSARAVLKQLQHKGLVKPQIGPPTLWCPVEATPANEQAAID